MSVDFEGGYSEDEGELADNISRLLELGVIGINVEDRVVEGAGLYDIERQAAASPSFARRPSSSDLRSSSMRGPICFLARAAKRRSRSARLSTEPRRTQPRVRPASSFPACEMMR